MAQHNYSAKSENPEHAAKAIGRSLPISTKQSVEICRFLRKKSLEKAKTILENVIVKKTAIPYKRYLHDVGHRPGKMAAGRYPIKSSREILALLNSIEANAQFKGLNTSNLIITHINAHKASTPPHYGRRRRQTKRTHVEIIVEEKVEKKAEVKPQQPKTEPKKPANESEKDLETRKEQSSFVSQKPKVSGKSKTSQKEDKKTEVKKPTKLVPKTGGFQA